MKPYRLTRLFNIFLIIFSICAAITAAIVIMNPRLWINVQTEIIKVESPGDKGDKGETGAKGDKGATGSKGDKGAPGAKGETGDKAKFFWQK